MSVQQTDTIDFMSHDATMNVFWLNMTEERPWKETAPEYEQRKAKVNTYISAVRSGDLQKQVAESRGKPIGIRIMCEVEPPSDAKRLLSFIKTGCDRFNIRFAVFVLEGKDGREIPIDMEGNSSEKQVEVTKKPWWKVW